MPNINYDALREQIEQDYLSDEAEKNGGDPEFLRVNKRFAKAHAEAAVACMKIADPATALPEPVTVQTLIEVLVMLSVSPIINSINQMVPEAARGVARKEAVRQFIMAIHPSTEFVESAVSTKDFREH